MFHSGVDSVFALLALGWEGSFCPLDESDDFCLGMIDAEMSCFVVGVWVVID